MDVHLWKIKITMNYRERYSQLNSCFDLGKNCDVKDSGVRIRFFDFTSELPEEKRLNIFSSSDAGIAENLTFKYPVFLPGDAAKYDNAILLLHGLNERSWNKYLTWAEYLAKHVGVPVILFPIAYHMNRAPHTWSNPRDMTKVMNVRKERFRSDRTMSFANVALSNRLSEHPDRFYLSGKQTLLDMIQLFEQIKDGRHPLFKEGAGINIFAYSIGAFLSQIALMDNQKNLFADSRLFMFCGGSIFSSMSGVSRSIMDKLAFSKLRQYYIYFFGHEPKSLWLRDTVFASFWKMITPSRFRDERERFFESSLNRISGIALSKDVVIPYFGVQQAMGRHNAVQSIKLQDFPFAYSHENPFPHNEKDTTAVNKAFEDTFSAAASFLSAY